VSSKVLVAGPDSLDNYLRNYVNAVDLAGGVGVRAWPDAATIGDPARVESYLSTFDALLLPGGKDLQPSLYGESPHENLGQVDPDLDDGQMALAGAARQLRFPTLAICRGIQVVGVTLGASLYQDLPSQRPSNVAHRSTNGPPDARHRVRLSSGSRLRGLLATSELEVNSSHHQALRESAPGRAGALTVVGTADDGVVEAVEDSAWPELIAVQWHPERLAQVDPLALRLFTELLRLRAGRR
jgi:putative glutamine amidotransferase